MASDAPHWPGGAAADEAPDGGRWLLDDEGLVIGYASPVYFVSPDLPGFLKMLRAK